MEASKNEAYGGKGINTNFAEHTKHYAICSRTKTLKASLLSILLKRVTNTGNDCPT